jgi:hypothetical protein
VKVSIEKNGCLATIIGRRSARDPFSTFGISDLNVERALGGSWPLETPNSNQVVGGNLRSMFLVDRTSFGLTYALRRTCSLVYNCSKNAEISRFSNVQPEIPAAVFVSHVVLE